MLTRVVLMLCALCCAGLPALGQPACPPYWLEEGFGPAARSAHAMVYDSARGRTVLFGGRGIDGNPTADTWEYDGQVWVRRAFTGAVPPARLGAALAYDAARGRTVLFGGQGPSGSPLGDTWVYDGASWTRLQVTGPLARFAHGMAYDTARQRVVLFGGDGDALPFGDTWEFNGTSWSAVSTVDQPPQRSGHAMAYDAARQRVVVVSGTGAFGTLSDTWTYDGVNWVQGPASPRTVRDATLVYDSARGGAVLFGGYWGETNTLYNEVSVLNAAGWTELSVVGAAPAARSQHGAVFDAARQVTVVFSGSTLGSPADTWELSGAAWTLRGVSSSAPRPRSDHSTVYDSGRQRTVLFGGLGSLGEALDDTWEFDGLGWSRVSIAGASPLGRQRFGLAYDAARQNTVLFGGQDENDGFLGDTWTFNGTGWTQVAATGATPPVRGAHAMVYDAARQRVVLFGGLQGFDFATFQAIVLNDTWEFDGAAWTQVTPPVSPSARASFQLAYDSARQRVVLFGGENASGQLLGDTWEFDGTTWTQVVTPGSPSPRAVYGMAYNAARQRVQLVGGNVRPTDPSVWEFDGTTWTSTTPGPVTLGERYRFSMSYDAARQRSVVFSGNFAAAGNTLSLTQEPASFVRPPVGRTVGSGAYTDLSVIARGNGLSYQWRRNGVPVSNSANVSGANTPTLVIRSVSAADVGSYDVVATGTCGAAAVSAAASVSLAGAACRVDFDNNGVRNIDDIFVFLNAWFANDPRADFDGVGGRTIDDIFIFLNAWFAGC